MSFGADRVPSRVKKEKLGCTKLRTIDYTLPGAKREEPHEFFLFFFLGVAPMLVMRLIND